MTARPAPPKAASAPRSKAASRRVFRRSRKSRGSLGRQAALRGQTFVRRQEARRLQEEIRRQSRGRQRLLQGRQGRARQARGLNPPRLISVRRRQRYGDARLRPRATDRNRQRLGVRDVHHVAFLQRPDELLSFGRRRAMVRTKPSGRLKVTVVERRIHRLDLHGGRDRRAHRRGRLRTHGRGLQPACRASWSAWPCSW